MGDPSKVRIATGLDALKRFVAHHRSALPENAPSTAYWRELRDTVAAMDALISAFDHNPLAKIKSHFGGDRHLSEFCFMYFPEYDEDDQTSLNLDVEGIAVKSGRVSMDSQWTWEFMDGFGDGFTITVS